MPTANTQEIEDFKNLYPMLSLKQKRIWNYLHWFCKNYRVVKPSHKHISEKVGCHRSTVIETIKKFTKLGWLGVIKQAWRTCIYFISEHFLSLDMNDKNTFRREPPKVRPKPEYHPNPTVNPTVNPTHINQVSYFEKNVRVENVQNLKNSNEKIPYEVASLPIPKRDKKLLSGYSLRVLRLAIEDFTSYERLYHVRNTAAFITARCKTYIRKFRRKMKERKKAC